MKTNHWTFAPVAISSRLSVTEEKYASASSRLEFGVVCHWLSEPFKGFNCQKSPWRAEPVQDSTDGMARCGTLNSKLDKTLVVRQIPNDG
jgi:hypothetical protein